MLEQREYNTRGELIWLWQDGRETRYSYRPDGLRYRKEYGDGSMRTQLWDGDQMVGEYTRNGSMAGKYIRGIGLIANEQDRKLQYFLHNAHGDVVERTNAYGDVLHSYDYDAFGNEKRPEKLDGNPWRYCGEYLDRETGTYYLRARYYDPSTGRFTSEDEIRSVDHELPNGATATDIVNIS